MFRIRFRFGSCVWTETEDGDWETGCGGLFTLFIGGPLENSYTFCPKCGRRIEEHVEDILDDWGVQPDED